MDSASSKKLGWGFGGQQLQAQMCSNVSCTNLGSRLCSNCRLVSYCSRKCQKLNWLNHKEDCKSKITVENYVPSWMRPHRLPSWCIPGGGMSGGESLWSNMPPINLLQGADFNSADLKICIVACSGLDNLLETVSQLPDEFTGEIALHVNDFNPRVVARHFLLLELLRTYGLDAVDMVIGVWYSSCLTQAQAKAIDDVLKALKPATKRKFPTSSTGSSVVTHFDLRVWEALMEMNDSEWSLEDASASRLNVMFNEPDLVESKLSCFRPQHRAPWIKHTQTGLLLPFATARRCTDTVHEELCPNKFLLHPLFGWTMGKGSDPLDSCNLGKVLANQSSTSTADLYGCLFFWLRDRLSKFLSKLESCKLSLHLHCMDARSLCGVFEAFNICFDRIDTSNLADTNYVGIDRLVNDWGPLLARERSSKSVLVTCFINWTIELPSLNGMTWVEIEKASKLMKRHETAMKVLKTGDNSVIQLFHDNLPALLRHCRIYELASSVGLVVRRTNLVVPPRIGAKLGDSSFDCLPGISASEDELYNLTGLNHTFTERYIEWEQA